MKNQSNNNVLNYETNTDVNGPGGLLNCWEDDGVGGAGEN